jgi:hypothetical protein
VENSKVVGIKRMRDGGFQKEMVEMRVHLSVLMELL